MPLMTDKYNAKEAKKNLHLLKKMYEKTLLDGNFQRWGGVDRGSGWSMKNGRSYITNFLMGATFNSIINGTINLLEVARFADFSGRIYFAGSSEIFGNTHKPANVQDPRSPLSPYAIAKDASLNTVQVYRQAYGLNCVTGILFNHESPFRSSTFVTRKIVDGAVACARDKSLKISLGNLRVARDWGWAEEYVEAMQILLRAHELEDQVICTGRMQTLEYFVERVFQTLGLNWCDHVEIQEHLLRPSEILESVGDPEPMKRAHGWKARTDVDGVIQRLVDFATSRE